MKNIALWIGAAVALLYVSKKDDPTFNLLPDFGVNDPGTWDSAPVGTGTANGVVAGSMADPLGPDFLNKAGTKALSGAAP